MSGARSPFVAFGLQAASCALKAKSGQLRARDREALAVNALEWVRGDDAACAAVVDFLAVAGQDQAAAGVMLSDFLDGWMEDVSPRRASEVLAGYQREAREGFDWMERGDCGHG